jgi:Fe2+ transport system protein B
MDKGNFHSELAQYLKTQDKSNAQKVILNELAKCLLKDRENFIEVLRSADISVLDNATDLQLLETFVNNAPDNQKLLLGASLLINHRNQTVNFDGEEELSDAGVKVVYKELQSCFCSFDGENEIEYANAVGAIAGAVGATAGLANTIAQGRQKKKFGVSDAASKQAEARNQLLQSVIAQKQAQTQQKVEETKSNNKRTIIIASVVGVVVLVGIAFLIYKKKQK